MVLQERASMMSSEANTRYNNCDIKHLPSAMIFSLSVPENGLEKPTCNVRKIDQTQPCDEKLTWLMHISMWACSAHALTSNWTTRSLASTYNFHQNSRKDRTDWGSAVYVAYAVSIKDSCPSGNGQLHYVHDLIYVDRRNLQQREQPAYHDSW